MITLGHVCLFVGEPGYRTTTVRYAKGLNQDDRETKIIDLINSNLDQLDNYIELCKQHGIRSHRVTSGLFPLATHDDFGYDMTNLPAYVPDRLRYIGNKAKEYGIRLSFHPGHHCVLNSPNKEVVDRTVRELVYHEELARCLGADIINIHGGGGYGDKEQALNRLIENTNKLPPSIKRKLTFENDEKVFTFADLYKVHCKTGISIVYDVHHQRCNTEDTTSIQESTDLALSTWDRNPLFHLSSPAGGWESNNTCTHSDYIDVEDFPVEWVKSEKSFTVDVEAKHKELAIDKLRKDLSTKYELETN